MPRLLAASFVIFLLTTVSSAQEQALQIGTAVERQLAPGQTSTFTISLQENQFVQLVVDQRGIDVVVKVASPDGKSLGDFDSPNGNSGPENVSFLATAAGVYRIIVAPLNQQGLPAAEGKFEIKIVEVRQATEQELKSSKNLEVVKAKGIALLGDVEGLIDELHSPATRIRAQLQTAQMLWTVDEKRARKYLNDAMAGVKDYLASIDTAASDYPATYSVVAQLRWEIIRVLADRDPELALSFLYSSKVPFNPYGAQRDSADQERAMELSIAGRIGEKDPKRTFEIARHSLKSGYSMDLGTTLAILKQKSPELAAQLAEEAANKLLNENLLKNVHVAALTMTLVTACNAQPVKIQQTSGLTAVAQPMLPEQTCRDLLQKAYQATMSFHAPPGNFYSPEREAASNLLGSLHALGPDLDTKIDGGAAAVDKKVAELNVTGNPYQQVYDQIQKKLEAGAVDGAIESIAKAPDEMQDQLYQQVVNTLASKGEATRARQIINDYIKNPYQRRQALVNMDQQELYRVNSAGKIDEALRLIATMKTPRERASMLVQVLQQIGQGQKRENALISLEQARSLLAPGVQAQDHEQLFALILLARAFSRYDSKRAFDIIEPLVEQVNELCAAAHTLDGFGGQYYQGDELDLQNGNNVANAATQVSFTLGSLAISNFERAKVTADRFRLPELRLRAYLDIAQQTIAAEK